MPPSPQRRGLELLLAHCASLHWASFHCASLDPDAPSARERLDAALGLELAQTLVGALSSRSSGRRRFAA